jgi:hypothetical protein
MIMLSWITKIKLELMAYEAMFAIGWRGGGGRRVEKAKGQQVVSTRRSGWVAEGWWVGSKCGGGLRGASEHVGKWGCGGGEWDDVRMTWQLESWEKYIQDCQWVKNIVVYNNCFVFLYDLYDVAVLLLFIKKNARASCQDWGCSIVCHVPDPALLACRSKIPRHA